MLTPKQEAFAQAVASGMNQSDAYRASFKVREATKPESVRVSAAKLMKDPNVTLRIEEIRKPIVEKAQITLESHLERLRMLSEAAEAAGQYSAAIKAEESRGKASGLYTEKVEHSGKDGGPIIARVERVIIDA